MEKTTTVFGRKPVIEALEDGINLEVVYIQEDMRGPEEIKIRNICKERAIPLKKLPKFKLSKMVRGNHQGVIAHMALIDFHEIETLIPFLFENHGYPTLLLLDGVTDVRNFGAIARTAEVMGVGGIIIPKKNSVFINSDAIKTSAGALLRMPVCRVYNVMDTLEYLEHSGFQIFMSSLDEDAKLLHENDFKSPSVLMLGSEYKGINPIYYEKATAKIKIPQVGNTDSLNVSVAAGVILYECLRQRNFNLKS